MYLYPIIRFRRYITEFDIPIFLQVNWENKPKQYFKKRRRKQELVNHEQISDILEQ